MSDASSPESDSHTDGPGRTRRLVLSGMLMSAAAIGCRLVSLGKELYVAAVYGAGVAVDAYSVAILVPWAGMAFFVNGLRLAFQNRVGTYEREGGDAAEGFGNLFLTQALGAATLSSLLVLGVMPFVWPLLAKSAAIESALASLTVPTAVCLLGMATTASLIALLNVRGAFGIPQTTHALPPLTIVLFVAVSASPNAATLVWGMAAGLGLQAVVLLGLLVANGHRPRVVLASHQEAYSLWIVASSVIAVDSLVFGNAVVDRLMATTLPIGSLSVLHWSSLLCDVFTSTFVISATSVLVPEIGRQAAADDGARLSKTCTRLLTFGMLFVLPISGLLVVAGLAVLPLLRIGSLDAGASASIGRCLAGFAFSLPGHLIVPLLLQVLVARGRLAAVVLITALAGFAPNVLLNLLLIPSFGVVGIAIATSIAVVSGLATTCLVVQLVVGFDDGRRTAIAVGAAVAAAAGATILGVSVVRWMGGAGWLPALLGAGLLIAVYALGLVVTPGWKVAVDLFQSIEPRAGSAVERASPE